MKKAPKTVKTEWNEKDAEIVVQYENDQKVGLEKKTRNKTSWILRGRHLLGMMRAMIP